MAKVHGFLAALFLFATVPLLAQQPAQPVRLELPFNVEETTAEVIALPDSSLLVYHKTGNIWNTKASFHFSKYDHQLEKVWSHTAGLEPGQEYIRHFSEAPYMYLIFGDEDGQQYTFARIHQTTGNISLQHYKLQDISAVYEYGVLQGNHFLIAHNSKDQKPVLLHLDARKGTSKMLPSVYGDESSFSDMLVDPAQGRVDVVLTESNGRISRLQVKSFDAAGELINNHFIHQQDNRSLLNAEITPGDSAQKLLLGVYGSRDLRYTRGFFARPLATQAANDQFYNMLQLKNFLRYMKPRREERTRRREKARLQAGKASGLRYRLLLHDLISTPDGYVLAGEIYYPQYKENTIPWNISSALTSSRVHEGYKRTHAVALGFDKNGVLLWDNAFPLKDVVSPELTHTIEVNQVPGGPLVMAYPKEDKIHYQLMHQDQFDKQEHKLEILTYDKKEKVLETSYPGIIRWYGGNFAAFGYQRIKTAGAQSRSVFYINKISFR